MGNEDNIKYKVGLFVLTGLVFLSLTVIALGKDSSLFIKYYRLQAQFPEVQGLQNGSVVSLSGIKVGNITKIQFLSENNALAVELRIDESYKERIRRGSKAKIRTQGALGDKYIYIEPAEISQPPLEPGGDLIVETGNDILSTLSEGGDQINKVFDILGEVQTLMKRINTENRSETIMKNLADSSQGVKDVVADARKLLLDIRQNIPKNDQLGASLAHLASILKKIDHGDGTLGALINDPSLHERMKVLLGGSPRNTYLKSLIRGTIQKSEQLERSQ